MTPVCETTMRSDDGNFARCRDDATHIVITPVGRRKACETHASAYASADGFLVRPIDDVCSACGAINVSRPVGVYCWCGSFDRVDRINVEGVWLALCAIHRPPPLWSLWKRLLMRWRHLFWRPKALSTAEVTALVEKAKERHRR